MSAKYGIEWIETMSITCLRIDGRWFLVFLTMGSGRSCRPRIFFVVFTIDVWLISSHSIGIKWGFWLRPRACPVVLRVAENVLPIHNEIWKVSGKFCSLHQCIIYRNYWRIENQYFKNEAWSPGAQQPANASFPPFFLLQQNCSVCEWLGTCYLPIPLFFALVVKPAIKKQE